MGAGLWQKAISFHPNNLEGILEKVALKNE